MSARTRLPPPPIHSEDKTIWTNWYVAVKDAINNLRADLKWINLDFTGSNLTDIISASHQDLDNLQGGSSTERYHVSSTQATAIAAFNAIEWDDLTDGGTTALHTHSLHAQGTLDFPSIASNATAELTMTVTGAVVSSAVYVGAPPTIEAGLIWCAYVSAADTVAIRIHNMSGGAIDPASATWHIKVGIH